MRAVQVQLPPTETVVALSCVSIPSGTCSLGRRNSGLKVLAADFPQARLWITSGWPTNRKLSNFGPHFGGYRGLTLRTNYVLLAT